ncbi:hypothetical protein FGO68_gene2234 [Halteria grandinella]|uniref:Uncharacterized protein n=1 Tax=Halteria grandinella TaxID=5974 RepID=A0A8J8P4L7_HALGN|nr:hypothetical protein FGO68_gene2234 [Halteria grandinella]
MTPQHTAFPKFQEVDHQGNNQLRFSAEGGAVAGVGQLSPTKGASSHKQQPYSAHNLARHTYTVVVADGCESSCTPDFRKGE